MSAAFEILLEKIRGIHAAHPDLRGFCDFPSDLVPQQWVPTHRPCADIMAAETGLFSEVYPDLRDAICAVSGDAQWRATYAGMGLDRDFMDRFACYCIVGEGGPWASGQVAAYLVYQPAGFWYPWHHHPAEEMYLVVAGEAEFLRHGEAPETLRAGGTSFHAANRPHALRTREHPVMALVYWRSGLGIKPVLTPPDLLK